MTFSSGRQGASLCPTTLIGDGRTKLNTPSPRHLTDRVGPSASSERFFTGQKLVSGICVRMSVCELVIWHTRRRWAPIWYGITLMKYPLGLPQYLMFLVVKINIFASDKNRTRYIQSAVPQCHWLCYMSVHFIPDFEARSQNCKKWPLASLCPSVRPHGTTRLPLDGFSGNFVLVGFSKNLSRKIKCH
jgi:hypothetical protein